jgi:hypothetical protein
MNIKETASSETMEWSVKAAVMAWELGQEMKAPNFQNHAMTRLFAAISRTHECPQFTTHLLDYVILRHIDYEVGEMKNAVEDLIIRNWGDRSIIDHGHQKDWHEKIC